MKLNVLLQDIVSLASKDCDVALTGLTLDSRRCQAGDVFCACPGEKGHGGDFIEQVLSQPVSAILLDADYSITPTIEKKLQSQNIPLIRIPHLPKQLALLADRFYNIAQYPTRIIAVTGTNGKTSICHFFMQAMQHLGFRCGVIGTTGYGFADDLQTNELTTPDIFTLHQQIASLCQQGADYIAMEASSHALQQARLGQIAIDVAIFTNLTPDHLDYHEDLRTYAQAKRLLFLQPGLKQAVINADDKVGMKLIQEFSQQLPTMAFSRKQSELSKGLSLIQANNIAVSAQGIATEINAPWGKGLLQASVLGEFNIENLLAVLGALHFFDIPFSKALTVLQQVQGVCGRMQKLGGGDQPLVIVDFSHTPDALAKALTALRQHNPRQLWCVFGCGGCRDQEKRPLMGKVASEQADKIVLTNDNPRQEKPEDIAQQILQGMQTTDHVVIELDRRQAIAYAIQHAQPDDIVLVAGKGHEAYQQIGDKKVPMHDQTMIEELLNEG